MPRPPSFADLDAALASLDPAVRRTRPRRSVVSLLTEARRLHAVVEPLRERFTILPDFDLHALDRLPELVVRAQTAEVNWAICSHESSQESLRRVRDEAVSLRYRLIAAGRDVLRDDKESQRELDGLHENRRLPQLVGDLRRLALLVDENADLFVGAEGLPDQPAETARRIAKRLIEGKYDPALIELRERRNATVALMVMAVAEVRSAGRYLLRHEPELLRRIESPVNRRQRRSLAKQD